MGMKPSKAFDELVAELQHGFEKLSDHRSGENTQYEIQDAALSAFGIFFTQSNSFLAYQRLMETNKGRSNMQSLFGAVHIPSDKQIRNLLDPQDPEILYGVFSKGLEVLKASGKLADWGTAVDLV